MGDTKAKQLEELLTALDDAYKGESIPSREELKSLVQAKFLQEQSSSPDASFDTTTATYNGGGAPIRVTPAAGDPGFEARKAPTPILFLFYCN